MFAPCNDRRRSTVLGGWQLAECKTYLRSIRNTALTGALPFLVAHCPLSDPLSGGTTA